MEYVQWRQSLFASTSASDKIVRHEKLNIRLILYHQVNATVQVVLDYLQYYKFFLRNIYIFYFEMS
jgi:hypothetical protein